MNYLKLFLLSVLSSVFIFSATFAHAVEATDFGYGSKQVQGKRHLLYLFSETKANSFPRSRGVANSIMRGPADPNVKEYFNAVSHGTFGWEIADVLGPFHTKLGVDSSGNLLNYNGKDIASNNNNTIVLTRIKAEPSGKYIKMNKSSSGFASTLNIKSLSSNEVDGTFQIIAPNPKKIIAGDIFSIKTVNGKYLANVSGEMKIVSPQGDSINNSMKFSAFSPPPTLNIGSQQIKPGNKFVLFSVQDGKFATLKSSKVKFTADYASATNFSFSKGEGFAGWFAYDAIMQADASGFQFKDYDLNNDNIVTSDELSILFQYGGGNSGAGRWSGGKVKLPKSGVFIDTGVAPPLFGGNASFMTGIHELTHFLGTKTELYNPGNGRRVDQVSFQLSAMGQTFSDASKVYGLDPWHKMIFGWEKPRVIDVCESAGVSSAEVLLSSKGTSPSVILFNSENYNREQKSGSYFIVEYRQASDPTGYDADVSEGGGVVVWAVDIKNGVLNKKGLYESSNQLSNYGPPKNSSVPFSGSGVFGNRGSRLMKKGDSLNLNYWKEGNGSNAGVKLTVDNVRAGEKAIISWSRPSSCPLREIDKIKERGGFDIAIDDQYFPVDDLCKVSRGCAWCNQGLCLGFSLRLDKVANFDVEIINSRGDVMAKAYGEEDSKTLQVKFSKTSLEKKRKPFDSGLFIKFNPKKGVEDKVYHMTGKFNVITKTGSDK